MAEETRPAADAADLAMEVTITTDARFVDTVRALASRMAEYAGCPGATAARLAEAVGRVIDGVISEAGAERDHAAVDIGFRCGNERMDVDVSWRGPGPSSRLEQALSTNGAATPPLRQAVDHVEFGHQGDRQFCRLGCDLPTST